MEVASSSELRGKIVVVTEMEEIPRCCAECEFGINTGLRAWCDRAGKSMSRKEMVTQRLPNCPLRLMGR